jgi:hypothetical protein
MDRLRKNNQDKFEGELLVQAGKRTFAEDKQEDFSTGRLLIT